uniref:Nucleoporin 62 C-terminal like n=1 Tax=Equus asinus asinus TaxID=83772 RepID=A0A8C4LGE6_EQUAS
MTYGQLDGLINKWSLELEDQENHFLYQAAQVNDRDHTLIENGEKIITLNGEVEKAKLDQQSFISPCCNLLTPVEESVKDQSRSDFLLPADEDRKRTYKFAGNIDPQLKRMAQDLKDVIERLNTFGNLAGTTDPLQQICKVLNAHVDSLQWINQNSGGSLFVHQDICIASRKCETSQVLCPKTTLK